MSKSKTSSKLKTAKGQLFVLSAPSGGGKSTLLSLLLADLPESRLSVSYTTRQPRGDEKDAQDYFFISPEVFRRMVRQKKFLEHAVVHGNCYGTSRTQVEDALRTGLDVFLDIDVQGARQIRKRCKNAVFIFIVPPSLDVLKERLVARNTEDAKTLDLRLNNAKKEILSCTRYDYIIVNEELQGAVAELRGIVLAHRRQALRCSGKEPVGSLLSDVKRSLAGRR